MANINETETERKKTQRTNQRINLKRLTRLTNPLANLNKQTKQKRGEKTQISRITHREGHPTATYSTTRTVVREDFENVHSKKL